MNDNQKFSYIYFTFSSVFSATKQRNNWNWEGRRGTCSRVLGRLRAALLWLQMEHCTGPAFLGLTSASPIHSANSQPEELFPKIDTYRSNCLRKQTIEATRNFERSSRQRPVEEEKRGGYNLRFLSLPVIIKTAATCVSIVTVPYELGSMIIYTDFFLLKTCKKRSSNSNSNLLCFKPFLT